MFEKEAEEYANRCACLMEDIPIIERAYKTGADFGYNKAKEEDKALIEKMKCCEICKHKNLNFSFSPFCQKIGEEIKNPLRCKCSEWELKED